MDRKEALNYTLPFGKYKNSALGDMFQKEEFIDYLIWMINNIEPKGKLKEALDILNSDIVGAKCVYENMGSLKEHADVVILMKGMDFDR